jgi:predicted dehydrogenase
LDKVNLGIIGCGIAARELHWPALQRLKDKFEIVMVCNHTEEKARSFAEMVGSVPYVLDYRNLLRNRQVEAVDIILPIELNYPATRDALKAGKHVMVEKPLGKDLQEAKIMRRFSNQYKQVMLVAENFRYRQALLNIKELIVKGRIGKPYAVLWNVNVHVTLENRYIQTRWRRQHKHAGGLVTDSGVHYMAALRMLFGEITSGKAFLDTVNPQLGAVDTFSLQFKTEKAIHGNINIYFTVKGFHEDRLIIYGTEGTIIHSDEIVKVVDSSNEIELKEFKNDRGFYEELLNFYEAIRNRKKVVSNFEEGYRDFRLMLTALKSAQIAKSFSIKS